MKITLNNREETFEGENLTIEKIIQLKNYTFKMLITKKNGELVKTEDRETTFVNDGDNIYIIHLISGG